MSSNGGDGSSGGASSNGGSGYVYPNGRQSLDLATRLPCLPNEAKSYYGYDGIQQTRPHRGGDACSLMEDSPSTITPPTQPSEAMYLAQEWSKSGGESEATISPTCVASFPPVEGSGSDVESHPSASNDAAGTVFFAEEGGERTKPKPSTCMQQQTQDMSNSNNSTDPILVRSTSSAAAAAVGPSGPEPEPAQQQSVSTKKKKKADDLLAQMRKSRFFTSSMFSKKKCGGVKSGSGSKRHEKKKTSNSITRPTPTTTSSTTTHNGISTRRSTTGNGSSDKKAISGGVANGNSGPKEGSVKTRGEREQQQQQKQWKEQSESPTPLRTNRSIGTRSISGASSNHHHRESSEESLSPIGVRRASAEIDDVLFCAKSSADGDGGQGKDDGVMITRVRSPARSLMIDAIASNVSLLPPEVGSDTNDDPAAPFARPRKVKNRGSSAGSQTKTQRRVQEVLSSITFDVPLGKANAERRAATWGGSENPIGRSRSAASAAFGQPAEGSVNDSLTADSDDSSSAELNEYPLNEYPTGLHECKEEDDDLFYDSDPGIVPARRLSSQPIVEEGGNTSRPCDDEPKKCEPEEDGVHLLSMDNSFDDESSFDAMFHLREDEVVRNVVEVRCSC